MLTHPTVQADMRKALSKAKIGKGNSPAVGDVDAILMKATMQPTSKPTKSPKDDDVPVKVRVCVGATLAVLHVASVLTIPCLPVYFLCAGG